MEINAFYQKIKSLHRTDRTILVGIDGLGGAGKSTIADELLHMLEEAGDPAVLLHMDDLIHPRCVRYNAEYPEWECYYDLQWRYDLLLSKILHPVRSGQSVDTVLEFYQLADDSYQLRTVQIPVGSIVILEGIFLQRKELAGMFDLTAYVDVPEEVRLQRVLKRDGYIGNSSEIQAKYERRYFPAERYYVQECDPASSADLIL